MSSERVEQQLLMQWARRNEEEIPELALLFHPPNGGWRHKATAARLKAMGAKAGVPDLFLPVPRGGYHGLWIEMKFGRNKPTKKQWEWIHELRLQDFVVEICYDHLEAEQAILEYLAEGRR